MESLVKIEEWKIIQYTFCNNNKSKMFMLTVDTQKTHLLLKRGGLGHGGAVDPKRQNKEVEEYTQQRHQMLWELGKIHRDRSRDRNTFTLFELEKQ